MKNCYILFLFLFSNIFLFAQSFTTIPGTDGLSKATAYQIWTKEHLIELGDSINSYNSHLIYPPSGYANWCAEKHFRLMTDIDNVNQSIGLRYFYGHFHGGGNKITVAIEAGTYNDPYTAPATFSALAHNGTIDSLTVAGYINSYPIEYGYSTTAGGAGITSGIISSNYGGGVTNCISNVVINITPADENCGGGIAGGNQGTIINCINNGDITGVNQVAGIAGANMGPIINCINTGKITAINSVEGAGGIAAASTSYTSYIYNCINLGDVEGQSFVGGIAGFEIISAITYCINYGYIKGTNAVGGICGLRGYNYNNQGTISNCVNAGVVEGSSDVGSITGKENKKNATLRYYNKFFGIVKLVYIFVC